MLTAPDGREFTATPSGEGDFIVDTSVDPDGRIGYAVAATLPGGEGLANPQPYSAAVAAGAIPSCVTVSVDDPGIVTTTVRAQNDCPATVYIKFYIAFAPDSECLAAPSGGQASFAFERQLGRFDRAETCG